MHWIVTGKLAILRSTAEADKNLWVKACNLMLKRLDEVDEKFKDDEQGRNHHTYREIKYWFENYGKVNHHFKI